MKIIPTPQKTEMTGGFVSLSGQISIDSRDVRLKKATEELNLPKQQDGIPLLISVLSGDEFEAYHLEITDDAVKLTGSTEQGAFWGIQTLRQIIKESGADRLPCCIIDDAPRFFERGFFHDVTRGKMPKLETLKKLVDQLAYYKINSLQLYVEHAFTFREYAGIVPIEEQLTAEEIKELDDYCYDHFIELIPCLATFGHLFYLLQSDRYRHLCELERYQPCSAWFIEWMMHHTIDATNPESFSLISSLIDQYAPLFRSKRFNICCDETFDLCEGRNKGKDKAETYFPFVEKIIERVKSHGKQVMMWGDILLHHPELIKRLPEDVTILNWEYSESPGEGNIRTLSELGRRQILCPGTSSWNCIVPCIKNAVLNITAMTGFAKQYRADGIINTNWGDYGNIGSLLPALYLMLIGAALSWDPDTKINEEFDAIASWLLFDDLSGKSIALLRRLSDCEKGTLWSALCRWDAGLVTLDFSQDDLTTRIRECAVISEEIRQYFAQGTFSEAFAENMLLNCRSVSMLCRIALSAIRKDATPISELNEWIDDFTSAWRKENKESEISQLIEFIRHLVYSVTTGSRNI